MGTQLALINAGIEMEDIDAVLEGSGPILERLAAACGILGERLDASRVVVYGNVSGSDRAIHTQAQWAASGRTQLASSTPTNPLIDRQLPGDGITTSQPRSTFCPDNCAVSHPNCPIRGECSTIVFPLKLADSSYGSLAVHDQTGRAWHPDERRSVQRVAHRMAVEVARIWEERRAATLAAERTGIATTILHQIATPVTVLRGVVEAVRTNDRAPVDVDMMLALAAEEIAKLERLCSDLAVIVQDHPPGEVIECDVRRLLADTVEQARRKHPAAAISLDCEDQPLLALCVPDRLQRVLANILDNAVIYTVSGPAEVNITASDRGDTIVVEIADNGPGLTDEQAQLVERPFVRLDPNMRQYPGGFGLGLSVARTLTHEIDASLQIARREQQRGTQVTLTLSSSRALPQPACMTSQ